MGASTTSLSLFFFFKQKTEYEMPISDWSSDVCSSDLAPAKQDQVYSTVPGSSAPAGKSYSTEAVSDPAAQAVKERFAQRFTELSVTAVRRTPYGIFEVQLGGDLVYTDEK